MDAHQVTSNSGLEVVVPTEGEFLIGDTPSVTLGRAGTQLSWGMALGDARTVVLPISPRSMIALGPVNREIHIPRHTVDLMNLVQTLATERHLFFRPGSQLGRYTSSVRQHMNAGEVPEATSR